MAFHEPVKLKEIPAGSILQISIYSTEVDFSLLPPGHDNHPNNSPRSMICLGCMDFFYDWHVSRNSDQLVGVSFHFRHEHQLPKLVRFSLNQPKITWENPFVMTIVFDQKQSATCICMCNQDFDGAILDMSDHLVVYLPIYLN